MGEKWIGISAKISFGSVEDKSLNELGRSESCATRDDFSWSAICQGNTQDTEYRFLKLRCGYALVSGGH
jgi:hypothetical protein